VKKPQRPRQKVELTLYANYKQDEPMGGYVHREAPKMKKSTKPDHRAGKFTRW